MEHRETGSCVFLGLGAIIQQGFACVLRSLLYGARRRGDFKPAIAVGVFTMLVSSALLALGEGAEPLAAAQVMGVLLLLPREDR